MSSATADPVATVVNGHTFTVDTRYVLAESRILGKGSFGVVCTAYDSVRRIDLAIKRIRPYANDEWDAKHTLREIRLLKLLGNHPNIITLYELSLFQSKTELYMMMELMDCDLHRVIQSKQALSEKHHKCFLKQMLEGIKAMHAIGVFHRDLKPGNILVSKDCQLRITDFGLARFMDESTRVGENELNPMTEYVVTRWYRPPELLLAPNLPYNEAVDLWSIGCILAELLRRKPLFPGKSHLNQAQLIFELKGYSNARELGFPLSSEAASFLDKKCRCRKQNLRKYIPDASDLALEMLEPLLAVDPSKRPTAEEALLHPFLSDAEVLHDYTKNYLQRPTPEFFEFEHRKFSVPQLKGFVEHEVEVSAADAYRIKGASPQGVKRRMVDQSVSSKVPATATSVSASTAAFAATSTSTAAMEEEEGGGPPSQLPTQQQRVNNTVSLRADKAANNPFARVTTGPARVQAQGQVLQGQTSDDIGNAAAAYRALLLSSKGPQGPHELQTDGGMPIPAHAIPPGSGNILTAVRNENPSHIPPGSRMKTPKTPSPKKMDQILQKDMVNKRRFLLQGGGVPGSNEATAAAAAWTRSQASQSQSRIARSTFPNPEEEQVVRRNRNVPFPSISARSNSNSHIASGNSASALAAAIGAGVGVGGGTFRQSRSASSGSSELKSYVESASRSHAMVHSGSNVINSEHQF